MINGEITYKEWAQKNRAYLGQLKSTKIKNKVRIECFLEILSLIKDPKAIENTKEKFKKKIEYCEKFENIFNLSDCAILMTPWENYKKISPHMIKKLSSKVFIDTRRMLKIKDKELNVISLGIGI